MSSGPWRLDLVSVEVVARVKADGVAGDARGWSRDLRVADVEAGLVSSVGPRQLGGGYDVTRRVLTPGQEQEQGPFFRLEVSEVSVYGLKVYSFWEGEVNS